MGLGAMVMAVLMAAAPEVGHEATVSHGGADYRLTYAPRVETRSRTIGHAFGPRPSTLRCRWTIDVQVERRIHSADAGRSLVKLLPHNHSITGERPGDCRQNARAVADAQQSRASAIRDHVVAVAAADRPAVLAEIDAARAFALN